MQAVLLPVVVRTSATLPCLHIHVVSSSMLA